MDYTKEVDAEDGVHARTAFRDAEKKYQLHRERKMKMKGGKLRPGKMITRPTDMSDVLDIQSTSDVAMRVGLTRHDVQGYEGPVYTFAAHPGLVFLPGALSSTQQQQLTAASLVDFPNPPARTNHELQYGPLPGLWRAAQAGLKLNWDRRDDPRAGAGRRVGCVPPKPHRYPEPAVLQQQQQPKAEPLLQAAPCGGVAGAAASAPVAPAAAPAAVSASPCPAASSAPRPLGCHQDQQSERCLHPQPPLQQRRQQQEGGQTQAEAQSGCCHAGGAGRSCAGGQEDGGEGVEGCVRQGNDGGHDSNAASTSCCGSGGAPLEASRVTCAASRACSQGDACSGQACSAGGCGAASSGGGGSCSVPSFEEAWSAGGAGPAAEQLMRKLRWATLGPQFDWSERQYDFTRAYRPLPGSLESIALRMARVAREAETLAGAAAAADGAAAAASANAAVFREYKPDAAIVNFYQQGDVLGGHLDDVERDMGQPIVSVSLGCPAVFLMGGPSKQQPPTALLLRGGDVLVLAGQARRCYHGVPRILEPLDDCQPGAARDGGVAGTAGGTDSAVQAYMRCARINISIRAVC